MTFDRRSLRMGLRDGAPIALAVVPFGAIVGVSAVQVGLNGLEAIAMHYLVFAGASQLAAYRLIQVGAPVLIILATTALINLRFTLYSAVLQRYLAHESRWWRVALAYSMTDQGFALAAHRLAADDPPASARDYILGSGFPIWLVWTVSAVAGVLLGTAVPRSWHLDFAVPLVFLALLVSTLRGRPAMLAALVGGLGSVLLAGLPLSIGMLAGASLGILAGAAFDRRARTRAEPR